MVIKSQYCISLDIIIQWQVAKLAGLQLASNFNLLATVNVMSIAPLRVLLLHYLWVRSSASLINQKRE